MSDTEQTPDRPVVAVVGPLTVGVVTRLWNAEMRAKLAQMAGLTDEERHAIDQRCYDQQREQDRRTGRDGIHDAGAEGN